MTVNNASYFGEDGLLSALLAQIRKGDEHALSRLYDLIGKRVYGIAKTILGDPDSAGEVTVEVFAKLWRQAGLFKQGEGSARVWINALSRNCSLDHLRKEARRARIEDESGRNEPAWEAVLSPETQLFRSEQADRLRDAMKALSQEQVRVIMAAYFEGMSHAQIATAQNKPLGTVKTQIRQALFILRRRLTPSRGEIL